MDIMHPASKPHAANTMNAEDERYRSDYSEARISSLPTKSFSNQCTRLSLRTSKLSLGLSVIEIVGLKDRTQLKDPA
jgi:hypothetical protein